MSNAMTTKQQAIPEMALSEADLMDVLRNSLYPGAQDASIKLVIGYCKAAGLDPMQKPVHIVPISVSTGKKDENGWDKKEMRDTVMPGIGLYRTQASRSGVHAGTSEPEFGEDVTETLDGVNVTYPKWCRVTVTKILPNGMLAQYTAKELWKENYATRSAKSDAPNAMWKKRAYGQLAKCTEAQALRKAFPEFGAQPTADEMEGKALDNGVTVYDGNTGEVTTQRKEPSKPQLHSYTDDQLEANIAGFFAAIQSGKKSADEIIAMISTRYQLSGDQIARIRSLQITHTAEAGQE